MTTTKTTTTKTTTGYSSLPTDATWDTDVLALRNDDASPPTTTTTTNNSNSTAVVRTAAWTTHESGTTSSSSSFTTILTPTVWSILGAEVGERFAFYGFRAILILYLTQQLQFSDPHALALTSYVNGLAYLSPIVGAIVADGYWGRYRTIVVFGLLYVAGLAVVTLAASLSSSFGGVTQLESSSSESSSSLTVQRAVAAVGLVVVCVGTGGIKPCVSALGADQVAATCRRQQQLQQQFSPPLAENHDDSNNKDDFTQAMVRTFFSYFYVGINIGALASTLLVPLVRSRYGFGAAFGTSLGCMGIAMTLFLSKRHDYVQQQPSSLMQSPIVTTFQWAWWLVWNHVWNHYPRLRRVLRLCCCCGPPPTLAQRREEQKQQLQRRRRRRQQYATMSGVRRNYPENSCGDKNDHAASTNDDNDNDDTLIWDRQQQQELDDARQALRIMPIFALLPVFWCLYDQSSAVWTLQATTMDLGVWQPEQLNVINPLGILLLIPLFENGLYPCLARLGFHLSPLRRMTWGMFLAAVSFTCSGWLFAWIRYRNRHHLPPVSVWWQVPQILLLTVAEIFVSVTGLEFSYAQAPPRLKAFLLAAFFMTATVGDLTSGLLYSTVLVHVDRSVAMHACAGLMLVNLLVFQHVRVWWEQQQQHSPALNHHHHHDSTTTSVVASLTTTTTGARHRGDNENTSLQETQELV